MKKNLKKFYIEETYRLLQEEGYEGFTIRKVAQRIGCSSSVLYKHFKDSDHLLILAAIHSFEKYSDDVASITSSGLNTLDTCLYMWESFLYYAIPNAPLVEKIFFGTDSDLFQDRLMEYYSEFPENIKKVSTFFSSIMKNANLQEREFLILKNAVEEGDLTLENADFLSRLHTYVFHGLLLKYMPDYKNEESCRKAIKEMMRILRKDFNTYRIYSLPAGDWNEKDQKKEG